MPDYTKLLRTAEEDVKAEGCCSYGHMGVCTYYLNRCVDILTCPYKRRVKKKAREDLKKEKDSGWVVENGKAGDELRYRAIEQGCPVWTADVEKAIRFARRVDAEMFSAEDEDAWRVTEHLFYGTEAPTRKEKDS